jgi:cell division GTPase FtsZ
MIWDNKNGNDIGNYTPKINLIGVGMEGCKVVNAIGLASTTKPLFSVDGNVKDYINNGMVTQDLYNIFKKNGYYLGANSTVEMIDGIIAIIDRSNHYIIKQSEEGFSVEIKYIKRIGINRDAQIVSFGNLDKKIILDSEIGAKSSDYANIDGRIDISNEKFNVLLNSGVIKRNFVDITSNVDIIFLVMYLGGTLTETHLAEELLKVCKESRAVLIPVVVKPLDFNIREVPKKQLDLVHKYSKIVLEQDMLKMSLHHSSLTLKDMNMIILTKIQSTINDFIETFSTPSDIQISVNDLKAVANIDGKSIVIKGEGSRDVLERVVIESPKYSNMDPSTITARGALIQMTIGNDVSMAEVNKLRDMIYQEFFDSSDPSPPEIYIGLRADSEFKGGIKIFGLLTGIDYDLVNQKRVGEISYPALV